MVPLLSLFALTMQSQTLTLGEIKYKACWLKKSRFLANTRLSSHTSISIRCHTKQLNSVLTRPGTFDSVHLSLMYGEKAISSGYRRFFLSVVVSSFLWRRMKEGCRLTDHSWGTPCTQGRVMAYSSKSTAWTCVLYHNSYLQSGGSGVTVVYACLHWCKYVAWCQTRCNMQLIMFILRLRLSVYLRLIQ